jgi:hypothetical protein
MVGSLALPDRSHLRAARAAVEANLASLAQALAPHGGIRGYLNFIETGIDPSLLFDPERLDRLRQGKAEAGPDGIFQANHALSVE